MFDFFERLAQTIAHHGDTYLSIAEEMYLKDDRNFYAVMARVREIRAEMKATKNQKSTEEFEKN